MATALSVLAARSPALAADFVPTLTQYAHASWRVRDGDLEGQVESITQTRDGYLWAGTDAGLERYDGTRFRHWPLPVEGSVYALLGARDGSLWVGGSSLVQIKDGHVSQVLGTRARYNAILEDSAGTIWLSRSRAPLHSGGLCKVDQRGIQCLGVAQHQPCDYSNAIAKDGSGEIWIGGPTGACGWRAGVGRLIVGGGADAPHTLTVDALAAEDDGAMLVGFGQSGPHLGLQRFGKEGEQPFTVKGLNGEDLQVSALLRDRQNALWIGTKTAGIYHIYQGKVDRFTSADGLSSDSVNAFYEDREGDIWVATPGGVDRFHSRLVTAVSVREGLSADKVTAVLGRRDGSVVFATPGGLDELRNGQIGPLGEIHGPPRHPIKSLMEDQAGKLWFGVDDQLGSYDGERFSIVPWPDGRTPGPLAGLAEDARHDLWVLTVGRPYRLFRIRDGRYFDEVRLPGGQAPDVLASDADGSIWIADNRSHLFVYKDAKFTSMALPGQVEVYNQLVVLQNGDVVLSSRLGAYYLTQGRWRLLNKARGLPCEDLDSATQDQQGALWLRSRCGLMMITQPDLAHFLQHPLETLKVRHLDVFDGAEPGDPSFSPPADRSLSGRLWFATDGVALTVDPAHLTTNRSPPAVHIEEVIADHRPFGANGLVTLPPRTRDVEIDYAGLSFIAPQKMRFRYRLIGTDEGWQDVGTRRAAFYMNLKPGRYQFQVVASNNDGVWNTRGDRIVLVIRPAFYQTLWFQALIVLLIAALVWIGVWMRIRSVTAQIEARLSERQAERTRIARELHDTLLQGFHGLLLRFQIVADAIPPELAARSMMSAALDRAEDVLVQGRDRVSDLRSADDGDGSLQDELRRMARDLERDGRLPIEARCFGTPRPLKPDLQREILAIAKEALTNACRHGQATSIFCELTFTKSSLKLVCGDNGVGIDPETMTAGRRDGHWGMTGMRERARHIGGVLEIKSTPGETTVILTLKTRFAGLRQIGRRLFVVGEPLKKPPGAISERQG